MKSDNETTIQELKDLAVKFVADRHWQRHHTPKNLTMSLAIEAAELMELYLWESGGEPDKAEVADELADVLMNVLDFALIENIDIRTAFINKYRKNIAKYPVEKFNKDADNLDEYRKIKKSYRLKKSQDT